MSTTRTVTSVTSYSVYDNDQSDVVWYSPSASDPKVCDHNLLNAIEYARKILRRNPDADIEIMAKVYGMCDGCEDGDEDYFTLCNASGLDALEARVKGGKA